VVGFLEVEIESGFLEALLASLAVKVVLMLLMLFGLVCLVAGT
jgi:hypothetical protein